jgi:hypothetical protein
MCDQPLPPNFPRTSGEFAEMLPRQRSIGGTRNITPVGPGYYSFNWWLNRTNLWDNYYSQMRLQTLSLLVDTVGNGYF